MNKALLVIVGLVAALGGIAFSGFQALFAAPFPVGPIAIAMLVVGVGIWAVWLGLRDEPLP